MISSHNVIHDNLLASSAFLQQLVTVIAQFHSGCALTIIKGLKSCRTSLKNDVCMIRAAAAEHTTPDRNARKAWHSYSYATGAYISVQSGICHATHAHNEVLYRITPQNLALNPHEMNVTSTGRNKELLLPVSALSGADGPAREHEMGVTHNLVSSCLITMCSNHGTKLCGMLITYGDHV